MGNNRTKSLQTVEIDGGNYTLIAERIKHLAKEFEYSIDTNAEYIESLNAWKVKAVLTITEDGKTNSYSGHASEVIGSSDINSTSALENAETSAVGRACAMAGIGVTENIASANEVEGAKEKLKDVKTTQRRQSGKSAEEKTLEKLIGNGKKNEK